MKIAMLAWSSFTADPSWMPDGPLLPIEFARSSPQVGLIPVLCGEPWVLNVRTLWAVSTHGDFHLACGGLAAQEGIPIGEIGYVVLGAHITPPERLDSLPAGIIRSDVLARIRRWGQDRNVDVVIWRDSQVDLFPPGQTLEAARNEAASNLNALPGNAATAAEQCIKRVPIQVWTVIRAHIAVQREWEPEPASTLIRTAEDLRFKDWQECRTTIGRLDTILEDLRKFGFSIITGLLTASAFLGFLPGVQSPQNTSAPSTYVRVVVFLAIMSLVAALFTADTYYEVLLSGAVERALDLEVQMDPGVRATKYLNVNATTSKADYIVLFLYLILLMTAEGLGILVGGGLNLPLWSTGSPFWIWCVGLVLFSLASILISWRWLTRPLTRLSWHLLSRPDWSRLLVAGDLGWFTTGLGLLLLSAGAKLHGVLSWVVVAGMLLALFIEVYWVYAALRSGLHREKPGRIWPEGKGKVAAP